MSGTGFCRVCGIAARHCASTAAELGVTCCPECDHPSEPLAPTVTLQEPEDDPEASEILELAHELAYALRSPEALARRLRELIVERYPERVASALWVTVDGQRDRGIAIEVYRLPWSLRAHTLWGLRTGGIGIATPPMKAMGGTIAIGAAVVAPYADPRSWSPAGFVRVSW